VFSAHKDKIVNDSILRRQDRHLKNHAYWPVGERALKRVDGIVMALYEALSRRLCSQRLLHRNS
jgi:hypothetical protein